MFDIKGNRTVIGSKNGAILQLSKFQSMIMHLKTLNKQQEFEISSQVAHRTCWDNTVFSSPQSPNLNNSTRVRFFSTKRKIRQWEDTNGAIHRTLVEVATNDSAFVNIEQLARV